MIRREASNGRFFYFEYVKQIGKCDLLIVNFAQKYQKGKKYDIEGQQYTVY